MKLPGNNKTTPIGGNLIVSSPRARLFLKAQLFVVTLTLMFFMVITTASGRDLDEVIKAGKLRHLGIV